MSHDARGGEEDVKLQKLSIKTPNYLFNASTTRSILQQTSLTLCDPAETQMLVEGEQEMCKA